MRRIPGEPSVVRSPPHRAGSAHVRLPRRARGIVTSSGRQPGVLDEEQLVRITATHRGFLYQHLYAVSCLLRAKEAGYQTVRIEADEDIELEGPGRCRYVQVKTRSEPLMPSDISDALVRFESLRKAHSSGEREGAASFAIAANVEAGPKLGGQAEDGTIPADVLMALGPNCAPDDGAMMPPPSDLAALFDECVRLASALSLSALRPETLVWKLAALVAWAATSEMREFVVADLPDLCEFVEAQLHTFPSVARYLPQHAEPVFESLGRVSLVVASEGAGKTAWAGNQALHSQGLVVYFRCAGIANEHIAPRLVREAVALAAKAAGQDPADLLLPGATGLEPLTYLDGRLKARGIPMTFVIDDAHGIESGIVAEAVSATSHLRWVVLARPGQRSEQLSARLRAAQTSLEGWTPDIIARVLRDRGCSSTPEEVSRLHRLTGGAPLFVTEAAETIRRGEGKTSIYLDEIEAQSIPTRSVQEILLTEALAACSPDDLRVAAAVAVAGISAPLVAWRPLLAAALDMDEGLVGSGIRRLTASRILTATETNVVAVHDAFRVVLREVHLTGDERGRLRSGLRGHLQEALHEHRDPSDLLAFLRVLAEDESYDELSDVASGMAEIIRDLGIAHEVYTLLAKCLEGGVQQPEARFWLEDTLAFFDLVFGNTREAKERLDRMEHLLGLLNGEESAHGAFHNKSILVHTALGTKGYARDLDLVALETQLDRVTAYNSAVALGNESDQRDQAKALAILTHLVDKYLTLVGLDHEDLFGVPVEDLARKVDGALTDDLRRLGDCFDATSRLARRVLAPDHALTSYAIPALKMYNLAAAPKSLTRTARYYADWFLEVLNDRMGAADMLEKHALPAATAGGLLTDALLVRAQLAEVHALMGKTAEAHAELESIGNYSGADTSDELSDLHASLDRVRHHLEHPPERPTGWYGRPGSIGRTSRKVRLILYRGWTIAVGQDAVDLDWGFQARRGFFWSCGEFMMSAEEPIVGRDFYANRDVAYEAAKRQVDNAEGTAARQVQDRRRAKKALAQAKKDKKRRRKERKRSKR